MLPLAWLLAVCVAGCARSRLGQQPGLVATWDRTQPRPAGTPPVDVILYTRQLRFDAPTGSFFGARWCRRSTQKQLERVMLEFPFLRSAGPEPAPYRLVIEATHATGGNKKLSTVSSLTKFIVPSFEETDVELEGRLMRGGAILKTYDAVGTYKTKKHLLLLLWPVGWGRSVPGETTADTFRDLFLQVERDAGTVMTGAAASASEASP